MTKLARHEVERNIVHNRNYTREGRVLHCQWYNSVIADHAGKIETVLSLVANVTDQIEMEEQLQQLQRMKAIGQLTGGIAHDFNNLLTIIISNAELLAERVQSRPDEKTPADIVVSAADKGAYLTRHLLAFARQRSFRPESIDVNLLISDMRSMLIRTLDEHVELKLELSASLPPALIDARQLESAILNLCINARDAMPTGGELKIETSCVHLDSDYLETHDQITPSDHILVRISDTGVGIAPEHIEKIFEPFFTTKDRREGSGLGLSMVFGFVKQSHGYVRADSSLGAGTIIRMYLPIADDKAATTESLKPAEGVLVGGMERVLLVEDNDMLRKSCRKQLLLLGYDVICATDGADALRVLEDAGAIDLLFTDIVMPGGINGHEPACQARTLRPDLKVLYTSGYADGVIVDTDSPTLRSLLLQKPYKRQELARMVRQALDDESPNATI